MKLEFTRTLGGQHFRIDDVEDDAPMVQIQFFNEFAELPPEKRERAARIGMEAAIKELLSLGPACAASISPGIVCGECEAAHTKAAARADVAMDHAYVKGTWDAEEDVVDRIEQARMDNRK